MRLALLQLGKIPFFLFKLSVIYNAGKINLLVFERPLEAVKIYLQSIT